MHFATVRLQDYKLDGVIWCVDFVKTNGLLPENSRRCCGRRARTLSPLTCSIECRHAGEYDRLSPDEFVVFFEPPSLDDRIVNQFALFSMMSSPTARSIDA